MSEVVVTAADNGRSCTLGVDDVLVVRLSENPTTGFRWAVDQVDDVLRAAGAHYAQGGPGIGAGGERTLTFRPERIGSGVLALKLGQEWEGDGSVVQRFQLDVVVR